VASPLLKAAQAAMKAAKAVGATKVATLRRTTSSYNPATGTNTTSTTDYSWTGVLDSYDGMVARGGDYVMDGMAVIAGDRRWLGAASDVDVTPDPETDTLIVDSVTYQIVTAKTDPAGATHELQVRR